MENGEQYTNVQCIYEKLLEILIDESDFEWLMIDVSHCKVHLHANGGKKSGNQNLKCINVAQYYNSPCRVYK